MTAIYLLVKKHRDTGLLYFCKTTKDNYLKYNGSGKYWQRHIKKYGKNIETVKVWKFENIEKAELFAIRFSKFYNIVESNKWANLIVENAKDGAPVGHKNTFHSHTEETKKIIGNSRRGKKRPRWIIEKMTEARNSKPRSEEENQKRSKTVSSKKWYNNGILNKRINLLEEDVPEGFFPGRVKGFKWNKKS